MESPRAREGQGEGEAEISRLGWGTQGGEGREIPHCNACVLFRRRGGLVLPGWGEGPRQPMFGRPCGLPTGPPSWCEAACPHLQPFHSTLSPHTPLEFSRWKFTSEALWPRILHSSCLWSHPPLSPSSPMGSRTEAPLDHRALLLGEQRPGKEAGPLVTPTYFSPLPTRSRHICDFSLSVVYYVQSRPPSQLGAGPASHGPRRPSQPSPEQPPACRPLRHP